MADHLRDERHGQEGGERKDQELAPVALRLGLRVTLGLREWIDGRRRVVAGFAHRLDQRLRRRLAGIEDDVRGLGREIDCRIDAFGAVQHLLDPGRAGGAGHPGELEVDGARFHFA